MQLSLSRKRRRREKARVWRLNRIGLSEQLSLPRKKLPAHPLELAGGSLAAHYSHTRSPRQMSAQAVGWVFAHSPYSSDLFVTHLALADSANDVHDNELWLSQSALATKARVGRQAVNRHLSRMVADGYLEALNETRGATRSVKVYRLLFPSEAVALDDSLLNEAVALEGGKLSPSRPEAVALATSSPLIEPNEPKKEPNNIEIVFSEWKLSTGRSRSVLDSKRRALISKALKLYELSDCIAAVRGWQRSPYHRGENDQGSVFNDIELLLRDPKHIEKFRDLELGTVQVRPAGKPSRFMQNMANLQLVKESRQ